MRQTFAVCGFESKYINHRAPDQAFSLSKHKRKDFFHSVIQYPNRMYLFNSDIISHHHSGAVAYEYDATNKPKP
jgi:hypothetical protein